MFLAHNSLQVIDSRRAIQPYRRIIALGCLKSIHSAHGTSLVGLLLSPMSLRTENMFRGIILSHNLLANWTDPSCESASKALSAARSILQYAAGLMESSWDATRLDRMAAVRSNDTCLINILLKLLDVDVLGSCGRFVVAGLDPLPGESCTRVESRD